MAGFLSPVPKQFFVDANNAALAGARIYFYASGTSTPLSAYSDAALLVPLTNPAVADAGGGLTFYLAAAAYKIIVKDSGDVSQYTVDPVQYVPNLSGTLDGTEDFGSNWRVGFGRTFGLSDSVNIAHGMTTIVATDVYGVFGERSVTDGGLLEIGLSDADAPAVELRGIVGTATPSANTPAVVVRSLMKNGTGTQALAATGTVFEVQNSTTALLDVLGSGRTKITGPAAAEGGAAAAVGVFHLVPDSLATIRLTAGLIGGATPHAWIQARDDAAATFRNLHLNPSGGNVGIGLAGAAPAELLHIMGVAARLKIDGTGVTSAGIKIRTNSGERWDIGVPSGSADFVWLDGSAVEKLRLTSGGQLGAQDGLIGTPALTFASDLNTGFYRVTTDSFAATAGGTECARFVLNVVGQTQHPDGAVATPAVTFSGDTDTGLYRIAANTLGIATAGAELVRFTATQVGIGGAPAELLHLTGTSTRLKVEGTGVTSVGIKFKVNATERWDINMPAGSPDLVFNDGTGAQRARLINAAGFVGGLNLGTSTLSEAGLFVDGDANLLPAIMIRDSQASAVTDPTFILYKNRGASSGTYAAILSADLLGQIDWIGQYDTTVDHARFAAGIKVKAAENFSATAAGADLELYTAKKTTSAYILQAKLTSEGSLVTNATGSARATNANDGFLYMSTCAGTPTGTPTAFTGACAWIYDSTNNIIYVYNGAWKKTAALT